MRRVDDHSSWIGSGKTIEMGAKQKEMASGDSAGSLTTYHDTAEKIKEVQDSQAKKAKSAGMKPGFRY